MSEVFMKLKKLYGAIQKVHDQPDGSIIVEGIASSEQVDSDGEIITAAAIKAAIPEYMKFGTGAVREMHQLKAAGTALDIAVGDDNVTVIKAHIVDSEAVKKVKANVYKGFSVGGSIISRDELNKTVITGIDLVEVSLVDRPANPSAVITCYKSEGIGTGEPLEKSFYSVSRLASLLESLQDFCNYQEYENQYEQRNTNIPPMVMDAAQQLGAALRALVNNEVSALGAGDPETTGEVSKAVQPGNLAKAGSRFSKATRDQLAEIHKALKDCESKMAAVGYDTEQDDDAAGDEATKGKDVQDLQKVSGELDLAKANLAKVTQERDTLQKRVTELEAKPEAPKALLKDLNKANDMGQQEQGQIAPVLNENGEVNELATAIKAAQAQRIS